MCDDLHWLVIPQRVQYKLAGVINCQFRRVRRNTFGTRVAGPTVWNSLPNHLRDPAINSEQFRRDLKT